MSIKGMEKAIAELLVAIGATSHTLHGTPKRVAAAYAEMLNGYEVDISSLYFAEDDFGKDQQVIVSNIDCVSLCPHHLLPVQSKIAIGYLPKDKVIGVSKLGRIALAFGHRMVLQEELTALIANSLMENLKPLGVAVVIVGEHSCMRFRGVKLLNSKMTTSEMRGSYRENAMLRQEFLALL